MAQITKIIPFDWEYYQANKDNCRVITSHEVPKEVTQLTKFESNDEYCLIGVFDNEKEDWLINGIYSESNQESDYNLQLEITEEIREGYVNLYMNKVTGYYGLSIVFSSKSQAKKYILIDEQINFIATIALHEIEKQINK